MNFAFLNESDTARWDEYVNNHPNSTFFHLSGWKKVIEKSFNHPCFYLYAEDAGKILGILPLVEVKSLLFGHALVSTPFCVYGGAIANSTEVITKLEQEAIKLANKLNVDYLELRYKHEQINSQLLHKSVHSTFGWQLAEDSDAILAQVKKKQRAVIRHSLKNELTSTVTQDLEPFYSLLSESYRNLGTPIFTKNYFKALIEEFQDKVDINLVTDSNNNPSNAVMNFYFKDQVLPYYGGGNADSRRLKSADFMYYHVMCNAKKRECTWFDFGRSKNDSGPYNYKKTWGMEPQPLHYYYHLVKANELPNLSPNNPKYKFFISMWQKLPLKLSQLMGPFLSKYLG
jgi:FemAB-related protein (PEP-CTERM system-associated)